MRARAKFFWDNFSKFFQKQCKKGEKHRSSHSKMFWEQGVLQISTTKIGKLASLGKNLSNFLEKYIWMSSSVVKLQASLQLYQSRNCYT